MNKIKYLASIVIACSSISLVSCGASSVPIKNKKYENIFEKGILDGQKNFKNDTLNSKFIMATKSPLYDKKYKNWGIGRLSDLRLGESEPIGLNDRIKTGQPKEEGMNPEDMWNWIPIENKTGDITNPGAFGERYDFNVNGKDVPEVETWFGNIDGEINRSTVPFKKYTHGEKIKPSQSTFGRMHTMPGFVRKNGDNNVGFLPTISDSKAAGYLSWQYTASATNWKSGPMQSITAPSVGIINNGHRNGVPVLGQMLMYPRSSGESEKQVEIITNEGPKNDYPIAKGMVEYALYIGFDGYFFDWESSATVSKVMGFTKAFNSYAKLGYYVDKNGVKHYIDNSVNTPKYIRDARKKYHYSYSPIMGAQYTFSGVATSDFYDMGDIEFTEQSNRHYSEDMLRQMFQNTSKNLKKDIYNDHVYASNWPEDGQANLAKIMKNYYRAGVPDSSKYGNQPSKMSYWLWNYNGAYRPEMDREIFSSYAGDPRYYDDVNEKGGFAFSNMIQEKTTIIGRKKWATSFDLGSGKGFFLNGSNDFKNSVLGVGKNGWLNPTMQSYLPTYQFISDFYNGKNEIVPIKKYFNTNSHKLEFPVKVTLDNKTDSAWFGGTTLSYSGQLAKDWKLVNKLYASNVLLKNKDKFEIIYKPKKGEKQPKPNLAVWTHNGSVPIQYYKNDGSEKNSFGDKVGFKYEGGNKVKGDLANLIVDHRLMYDKETSWNVQRDLNEIRPMKEDKLNNGEWIKLTYDLSSLNGKSMMDFGLSLKNNENNPINMDDFKIGYMSYQPEEYKKPIVDLKGMTLDKIWKNNVDTIKARVSFEAVIKKQEKELNRLHNTGDYVRYYMTFYSDKNWNNIGLAWVGENPKAYLNKIPMGTKKQNLTIYAIGNDYNILASQKYQLNL